ncbi:MAG: fimbrial protein [Muribaculaceae bacterium]
MKYIIAIISVALLVASCTSEVIDRWVPDDMICVKYTLPSDAVSRASEPGSDQENYIDNVRILLYDESVALSPQKLEIIINTGETGVTWDKAKGQIIFPKSRIADMTKTYRACVLANISDAEMTAMNIKIGDLYTELAKIYTTISAPITVDSKHYLRMCDEYYSINFSKSRAMVLDGFTRQAVKLRVTIKIDPAIEQAPDGATFSDGKLTTYNVPNYSHIFRQSSFEELKKVSGFTLLDFTTIDMAHSTATNEWTTTIYAYENPVATGTVNPEKEATYLILKLPYTSKGELKTENYYKIMVENPTPPAGMDKYATQANNLYDVVVTIKGFGGRVPAIDGTEVSVNVLPWNEVSSAIDTPENSPLQLTNTSCHIIGNDGTNVRVAQVTLTRPGLNGTLTLAKEGTGFELPEPTTINMNSGIPYNIRIDVTDRIQDGAILLTYAGITKKIIIDGTLERSQIILPDIIKAISDVRWCKLSRNAEYDQSEQKQSILFTTGTQTYLNISKTSLGDNARIGTIMCTKADKTVTRVVVLQQPFIEYRGTKWATGNIDIGHRPDGTLCYVIGGTTDYGLWFRFMQFFGYVHEEAPEPWSTTSSKYYIPSKNNLSVSATLGEKHVWEDNWNDAKNKADSTTVKDPCSYVYTADPTIKWRTPTGLEIDHIFGSNRFSWVNIGGIQGVTYNRMFLRAAGRRQGKAYNGKISGTESSGNPVANYLSDESINDTGDIEKDLALVSNSGPSFPNFITGIPKDIAISVRCVRDK